MLTQGDIKFINSVFVWKSVTKPSKPVNDSLILSLTRVPCGTKYQFLLNIWPICITAEQQKGLVQTDLSFESIKPYPSLYETWLTIPTNYATFSSRTFKVNLISDIIIHQIFSLACDWSKHVTWWNIPQFSKPHTLQKRFKG